MGTTYKLLQKWLGYLFLCFAVVVVAITTLSVVWDYRDIGDKAIKSLKTASLAVESELNGELIKYDKRIAILIDQVQKNRRPTNPSSEVMLYWLRFSKVYNQAEADYFFMEPGGNTQRFLQKKHNPSLNLQSYKFIQDRLHSNDLTMVIGKTMQNPWRPDQLVMPLTRKAYRGSTFIGIVGALVPIEFYQLFLQRLELPANVLSALVHTNEGILVTYPLNYTDSNNLFSRSSYLKEQIEKKSHGYFFSENINADQKNLVYYSRLSGTPLYAVIARDYKEIFASWHDGVWVRAIITLLTFLFLSYIYYVMTRQISHIEEQERKSSEYNHQLRQLVQTTSRVTGEEFFQALSKQFHDTTGFRYISVSTIIESEPGKARTLVVTDNGNMLENLTYDLKDTIGEATLKNGLLLCSSNLQEIFPDDKYLKGTEIQSYVGSPLKNSQGKTLGIIAVLDEKPIKNPDMIRSLLIVFASRAGAELERMENENTKKQLAQTQFQYNKMESLGRLAGGMAHDFNNILMMLFGNIDRIKDCLPQGSEATRYLDKMELSALRAKGIVQQILTFSRKQEPKKESLSVQRNIEEVYSLFSEIIPSKIEMKLQLDDSSYVMGDTTQFHQILTNICSNSIYAMRDQAGILKITTSSIDISREDFLSGSSPLNAGKYVQIEISDNGIGIEKEDLQKIFDPFYTTKPVGEGTGLGLSVVHGILQSWNGYIEVESARETGTTTRIYLPKIAEDTQMPKLELSSKRAQNKGKTVLVVDDEVDLVEIMCAQLEQEGIHAKGFTQSEAAFIEFQKNFSDYDFIISDVSMPGMNGIQLFDKIQEIRKIPMIFTTGNSMNINLKFKFSPEVRVLEKPYPLQDLVNTIDSFI